MKLCLMVTQVCSAEFGTEAATFGCWHRPDTGFEESSKSEIESTGIWETGLDELVALPFLSIAFQSRDGYHSLIEEWAQRFVPTDLKHADGLIGLQAGLVLKSSKKLFPYLHFSVILLKHASCLVLSELMEFSHGNWLSCSGLTAVNIGVVGNRGLRQHLCVCWGAGKSVHQNIVTGNWEHNVRDLNN